MKTRKAQEILPVMVGIAGHVDHGKTSLVRNLTGVETDRLREEKERGLSIDLGVAPWRLSDGRIVGIIDVPGHLDFIRNMVVGASSIDILVLVIAADDGVMPQTREHLEIVRLLRTPKVLVVLSKIDMVDEDIRKVAREEISDFMGSAGFPDVPVLEISNLTGEGMAEVRRVLEKLAQEIAIPEDSRAFRMPIRQGFPVKGRGSVLTGIPVSGSITIGSHLEILPKGISTSLRAVQNFRENTGIARSHVSAGLNVRDVRPELVRRGLTLAVPGIYKPTTSALVYAQNSSKNFVLRRITKIRFFCGASSLPTSCKLINRESLPPGQGSFMQVNFSQPLTVATGDRFILRCLSPSITIGGGTVLSARRCRVSGSDPWLAERLLQALEAVKRRHYFLCELLAGPDVIFETRDIPRLTQHGLPEAEKILKETARTGEIEHLCAGKWIVKARIQEVVLLLKKRLQRYHETHPDVWGMEAGFVCRVLGLDPKSFSRAWVCLGLESGMLLTHGRLALKGFQPTINPRAVKLRERLLTHLSQTSPNWVARNNLMEELKISKADMKVLVRLLQEDGSVLTLGNNLILSDTINRCRQIIFNLFDRDPDVDVATFRHATGLSRNPAIAVLEFFDSEGLTRREGDRRVLARTCAP